MNTRECLGSKGKIVVVVIVIGGILVAVIPQWNYCSCENFRPHVGERVGS